MSFSIPLIERDNFYAELLNGEQRAAYLTCRKALSNGQFQAQISLSGDIEQSLEAIFRALIFGCPELFFLENTYSSRFLGERVTVDFVCKYPSGQVRALWAELNKKIDEVADLIAQSGEGQTRLYALNDYLCKNVAYCDERRGSAGDAWGALVDGTARCEGICKAAMLVLERLGMSSIIADGRQHNGDESEVHGWNIVRFGEGFYHFDFTQNLGGTVYGIPDVCNMFLSDSDIFSNKTTKHNFPKCNDAGLTYWAQNEGVVRHSSDFTALKIEPCGNHFFAVARLEMGLDPCEIDERAPLWLANELSGFTFGRACLHRYNPALKTLSFYMLNDDD